MSPVTSPPALCSGGVECLKDAEGCLAPIAAALWSAGIAWS